MPHGERGDRRRGGFQANQEMRAAISAANAEYEGGGGGWQPLRHGRGDRMRWRWAAARGLWQSGTVGSTPRRPRLRDAAGMRTARATTQSRYDYPWHHGQSLGLRLSTRARRSILHLRQDGARVLGLRPDALALSAL